MRSSAPLRRGWILVFLLGLVLAAGAAETKSPSHQALEALLREIDAQDADFDEAGYRRVVAQTLGHFSTLASSEERFQGTPVRLLASRLALQIGNVLLHRHGRMEDARQIARSAQSAYGAAPGQGALMREGLSATRKGFRELAGEEQYEVEESPDAAWGPFEQVLLGTLGLLALVAGGYLLRSRREVPEGLTTVDATTQSEAQAALNLGLRLLREERTEEAMKYLRKVADLETGLRGQGEYYLALVTLQRGRDAEARTMIEALDFRTIPPEEAYGLGEELERRGQTQVAKKVFEKIYLEDTEFRDVRERLEKLREETSQFTEEDVASVLTERVIEDRFRNVELLASGGMGYVFSVEDKLREGQRLALKVLSPFYANHDEAKTRFLQEARGLKELDHPHIIRIHDVFEKSLPYYTMDFHDSPDLRTVLSESGALPVERVVAIAGQLCQALQAAHEVGIVHRDVKPGNVLVGEDDRVTLLDFGIARFGAGSGLTLTGQVLGSPRYMAPEQHTGEPVDQRCDIYAVGVLLYQMLAGALPPGNSGGFFLGEYPPLPEEISAPPALRDVLARALRPNPADRPGSIGEILEVLHAQA